VKRPKPQSAADARGLIASEVVKSRINPTRLAALHKCLRMFERVEQQVRKDREIAALTEQNRIEQEKLEVKKAEYRRRALNTSSGSIIALNLRKEIARLKSRVAELEADKANSGSEPTLTETRYREQ
jgi:hypothetical protein